MKRAVEAWPTVLGQTASNHGRRLIRPARMHPGLLAGCAAGFLCAWFVPGGAPALVRGVFAWDATALVFLPGLVTRRYKRRT